MAVCFTAKARAGAVGLRGVGCVYRSRTLAGGPKSDRKRQLAVGYACHRREADDQLWLFQVYANTAARFEESHQQTTQYFGIIQRRGGSSSERTDTGAWLAFQTSLCSTIRDGQM